MSKISQYFFHIYRYQILPLSQQHPLFFQADVSNIKELKLRKNEFFAKAVLQTQKLIYNRADLIHKIIFNDDDIIIFKIGVNRILSRNKPDFTEEEIDNWPNLLIVLNNKEHIQKAAIQFNRKAFSDTQTVSKLFEHSINNYLSKYYLKSHFNPMFTKQYFWDIVSKHPTGITQTCFEMISPNMSNISSSLKLDLRLLNETTNTQETSLELNSDKSTHLSFDRDNEFINSLVEYASEGGGNISMKVKGYKRKIHTSDSINEYEIDEFEIKNAHPNELAEIFRGFLV